MRVLLLLLWLVSSVSAQQRFTGTVDIDGDATNTGGLFVELGVTIPYTNPRGFINVLSNTVSPGIVIQASNSTGTTSPIIALGHSRATVGSETVTQSGDVLGTFLFQGYTGNAGPNQWGASGVAGNAAIEAYASQNFSTTNGGSRLSLYNTTLSTHTLQRFDAGTFMIMTRFQTLPTGTTPTFYGIGRDAAGNTTETTAGLRTPVPAMHWFAMTCAVTPNAGTGSDALTFALRDDAANVTGLTGCTITTSATSCNVRPAINSPGTSADGSLMAISVTGTSTPAATEGYCILQATVDAWSNS
jgi:hypothetical protein